MYLLLRLLSRTLVATSLLLLLSVSADAETVKLRSGRTLRVESAEFGERVVHVRIGQAGGAKRVDLRFEALEPRGLLQLFDRTTDVLDGAQRLRSAHIALEFGERAEAALRFQEAARLDAALAPARDAGLATLRSLEAADALVDLEARLRAGAAPRGALTLATAILEGPYGEALSSGQRLRIRALRDLALRRLQRDALRRIKVGAVKGGAVAPAAPAVQPVPPAAPATAQPPPPAADDEPLEDVRRLARKAMHARDAAADPNLSAGRAIRHLEIASKALLDARRELRALALPRSDETDEFASDLRIVLLATYLDLADLHRQEGRFDEARAYVRAVLILDPGNEEAWEQRQLIEDDLHREPTPLQDPYDRLMYGGGTSIFFGRISPSPFYGLGCYPRAVPFGYGGFRSYGVHFGYRHGHARTHRVVGSRR